MNRHVNAIASREDAKNAKRSKTNLTFFEPSRLRVNNQVQP